MRRVFVFNPGRNQFLGVKNQLKTTLTLLMAAAFLAGCAAPQQPVTTYRDPLTQQETDILAENELVKPGVVREVIFLNAARIPVRGEHKIYLEVEYNANKEAGYLEIYPGRTLTIIADGQELKFSGLGSLEKREKNNVVTEIARYESKLPDIATIANARKVTVLIQGKDLLIERDFNADNFTRFKQFYETVRFPGRANRSQNVKNF